MTFQKALFAILAFCACAVAAAGPYEAQPSDSSLQTMIARWAAIDGKRLVWEVDGDAAIKNADGVNESAKLGNASSFKDALNRLDQFFEQNYTDTGKELPPLMACIYSDAIVVRTFFQPPCHIKLEHR